MLKAGFSEATPSVVAVRFPDDAAPNLLAADSPLRRHVWSVSFEITDLQEAKDLLAQKLRSTSWQTASLEEFLAPNTGTPVIPVPRARPAEASLDIERSALDQTEPRTLLQKALRPGPFGFEVVVAVSRRGFSRRSTRSAVSRLR